YFAQETGIPCVVNYWMPDGFKDFPADRTAPRARMAASLDEIFAEPYDKTMVYPTLESKVFGIGLEANTVGSAEFCLSYSAAHGITPLIDNGHYHPMETVGDKISSLLLFNDKLATHLTRPMRWDSDHVVLFDDDMRLIAQELVRNGLDRAFLATDFFDASINRVSAWITGLRNVHKALLYALLEPTDMMRKLQDENRMTELMVIHEDLKTAPFGDIWDEYLRREGIEANYIAPVLAYEKEILEERK
ncbi:MAG: L-rhamnose isomerase, partial [Clostridia bacterium]|nr:L-rhamnose isomerase [Clostridia bacterium]